MLVFADKAVRNGFVTKVFGIVALQMLYTIGFTCMCIYTPGIKEYVIRTQWLFWLSWIVSILFVMVLTFATELRRKYPVNMLVLLSFTLVEAWMVGMISCFFQTTLVLIGFVATAAVIAGVTFFAMQTRWDITSKGMYLMIPMIVLVVMIMIGVFWENRWWYLVISAIAACLFCCYLMYDVQLMVGGKAYSISPEDYIFAATSIYLDCVQILVAMISLISLASGKV